MRRNTGLFFIVTGLIASIVIVSIYIGYLLLTTPNDSPASSIIDPGTGITVIEPPVDMPDFTLTNQNSDLTTLWSITTKPTILTFGFTHCPDVCPLTLQEMKAIREGLGKLGDNLNYVFISVDGERDTPEVLSDYFRTLEVNSFVIGLTGSPEQIRELGQDYRLFFAYGKADETGNYAVEHTAGLFLLDSENRWIRRYAFGTERAFIVEDLQNLLK